jgi:3-methyladenine DNA glycosylase AlkD
MPEILRIGGYRFFFFSREGEEPRHVHVEQAERYAKFWLEPIQLTESRGFRRAELRELHSLIAQNREEFILAWDEHFSQ